MGAIESVTVRRWRHRHEMEWTTILLDDTDGAGRVVVHSSFGGWVYSWPAQHRGDSPDRADLARFFAMVGVDYAGNKMCDGARELEVEETVAAIRERICQLRRDESFTRDEAREEWDLVRRLDDGDIDARAWVELTTIPDGWEMPVHGLPRAFRRWWEVFHGAFVDDVRIPAVAVSP